MVWAEGSSSYSWARQGGQYATTGCMLVLGVLE